MCTYLARTYFFFPPGAGDRARARVVLAGARVGVAVGVVAEFGEHPCAEYRAESGLAEVHRGIGMSTEQCLDFACKECDFVVERLEYCDQGADDRRVGLGDSVRLGQVFAAKHGFERSGLLDHVPSTGTAQRIADLR